MESFLQKSLSSLMDGTSSRKSKTRYLSLNEGLQLNTKIYIEGRVFPAASKFEINLWSGFIVNDELLKNGNIALHFCVHPANGYALLNSRSGKNWGQEERTPRGRLPRPLLQKQNFKLCIEVERNQYRIDVNDHQFVTFLHRHAYEDVGLISYDGEFNVDNVEIKPPVVPQASFLPSSPQNNDHVICDIKFPTLPLLMPIEGGLSIGMSINLIGRITGNRFDLSLYQGPNPYGNADSDVAFHMEVHINEMSILRNSNQNNQWKEAERDITHFPFFGQGTFNMTIRVEGNRYQVNVGGRNVFSFYHRITKLSTIDHLCMHGFVEISSLSLTVPPL